MQSAGVRGEDGGERSDGRLRRAGEGGVSTRRAATVLMWGASPVQLRGARRPDRRLRWRLDREAVGYRGGDGLRCGREIGLTPIGRPRCPANVARVGSPRPRTPGRVWKRGKGILALGTPYALAWETSKLSVLASFRFTALRAQESGGWHECEKI